MTYQSTSASLVMFDLFKEKTINDPINRFGKYSIDKNIDVPELKFDITVI